MDQNLAKRGRRCPDSGKTWAPGKGSSSVDAPQEAKLQQILPEKWPSQMGLPYALWSRNAIQALIWQMWRITIAKRTLTDYLKRWGFTPQKPLKRAYEQNPQAIEKWHKETYPAIKKQSAEEGAEIWWGDETGIKNTCQHSRGLCAQRKNARC
nr:winged helix-turn-helix domain-containing protein [Xenorhabdus nematophila]